MFSADFHAFTLWPCSRQPVQAQLTGRDGYSRQTKGFTNCMGKEFDMAWRNEKKKKRKKKYFLAFQLMTIERAPVGWHHHVFPLYASTLKWVRDLPTHNAFAKGLWESEFCHNFPDKHRQFQTFQPSQLAFVRAIWHSHNAHVFQMPPSCFFNSESFLHSKGILCPLLNRASWGKIGGKI